MQRNCGARDYTSIVVNIHLYRYGLYHAYRPYALRIRYDTESVPNWSLNTLLTVRKNRAPTLPTHVHIASAYVANLSKVRLDITSMIAYSRGIDTVRSFSRLERPAQTRETEALHGHTTMLSLRHSRHGGGHTPSSLASPCPEEASGDGLHTPSPHPIASINDWAHMLLTHTHEKFASLAALQKDHTCPPCGDASGVALLRPSQIQQSVYGG